MSITAAALVRGKLPAPSWIRTDRIVTLNTALVIKTIGRVSAGTVDAAVARFCARIGYSVPAR
jgi:hypothetical protein